MIGKKPRKALKSRRGLFQPLEDRRMMAVDFSLQILHASDLEGGVDAIHDAPNFAAVMEALETNATASSIETIKLSAGDNSIPGPFFNAAGDRAVRSTLQAFNQAFFNDTTLTNVREAVGRIDVSIMNAMGFDASALGNHEFDSGTSVLADQIGTDIRGTDVRWLGAQFPYLSANLDFSGDSINSLYTDQILPNTAFQSLPSDLVAAAAAPKLAPATLVSAGSKTIGLVGATTQVLEQISSPGGVTVLGPNANDMSALATYLQPMIDAVTAAGADAVVLVSHLQQIEFEQELAGLLTGVDVIIAGGSDTLLADSNDRLRAGDTAAASYPIVSTALNGDPVAIVSTAGKYNYVGRLVVDFDENGLIIPSSIDINTSGVYATDDQGVVDVTGAANRDAAISGSVPASQIDSLVSAVSDVVTAKDGVILGKSDVFLEGRRNFVRTQETNMGNLTADANLAVAKSFDSAVQVSLKNGGGIRSEIGSIDGFTGELLPTSANPAAGKNAGDISQLDIESTLRFNNGLTLLTVSANELRLLLEHGVAATDAEGNNTPGQFPQVSGLRFSFDPTRPAISFDESANIVSDGSRIRSLVIVDDDGVEIDEIVRDGELVGDPNRSIRMVTLDFLWGRFSSSEYIGGDGYPYPAFSEDVVQLGDAGLAAGDATFTSSGSEQDALAEFLLDNYGTIPFDDAEVSARDDVRIQNLNRTNDSITTPYADPTLELSALSTYSTGVFDESAAEILAYDSVSQRIFSTNADSNVINVLDISDPANPVEAAPINPIGLPPNAGGINSVAVSDGMVAAAVAASTHTDPGVVIFYSTEGSFLGSVEVGSLPDSLMFSHDGNTVVVACEGEPDDLEDPTPAIDPMGTISVIDVTRLRSEGIITNFDVSSIDFTSLDGNEDALREAGIRIFPGRAASVDLEPEFVTVTPDNLTAVVTLQEANAIARIDLVNKTLIDVLPLGTKDHSIPGNGIDASNRDDAINIRPWNVKGMFMPDAITSFEWQGETFYMTANEGDSRDFDESRIRGITLDPVAFPNAASLQADANLGRLKISNIDGDIDGDGDFDELYSFGARSFTIWSSNGSIVFDSGDQFEEIVADSSYSDFFNSTNDENAFDNRSDDKGPEPEAITVGQFGDRTLAFIGLERVGGVMTYDISNPFFPSFVGYLNNRDFLVDPTVDLLGSGDLGVEDLVYIPSEDSPNGQALLVSANEVSGTVSIFQLQESDRAEAALRVVATPTDTGNDDVSTLPQSIASVPVGGVYFVEVWARDSEDLTGGFSGGQVDLNYDTNVLDAVALYHNDFPVLESGTIRDEDGIVDDFGGGVLQNGRGEYPDWVRVGYVEVQATASGTNIFSLDPGSLQFGRLDGGGNIPWRSFDLSDTATVSHVAAPTLEMRVVNQQATTDANGEVALIPSNDSFVTETEPYYVDFYASNSAGIQGATISLQYETAFTSASDFIPGPAFTLSGGQINDVSGEVTAISLSSDQLVGDDQPVLVASIRFEPSFGDDAAIVPSEGSIKGYDVEFTAIDTDLTVSGVVTDVAVPGAATTQLYALPYDFDNNGVVDFSDYANFRDAFGRAVGTSEPPYANWADYDGSQFVDFADFNLLVANFGKRIGQDSFVYPPGFPNPTGGSGGAGGGEGEAIRTTFYASGPFHNYAGSTDVNNSGDTTSVDALIVINALIQSNAATPYFLDVNADDEVTALDALRIINALRKVDSEGEAIQYPSDYVASSFDQIDESIEASLADQGLLLSTPKLSSFYSPTPESNGRLSDIWDEVLREGFSNEVDGLDEIAADLDLLV